MQCSTKHNKQAMLKTIWNTWRRWLLWRNNVLECNWNIFLLLENILNVKQLMHCIYCIKGIIIVKKDNIHTTQYSGSLYKVNLRVKMDFIHQSAIPTNQNYRTGLQWNVAGKHGETLSPFIKFRTAIDTRDGCLQYLSSTGAAIL